MNYEILSELVITNVRSAMTIFTEKNTRTKRKNRPCWAVILKYEGETVYTVNGKKIVSNANNPVILPKGSTYEWQCIKGGHYAVIEFDCNLEFDGIFGFNIKNNDKILKLFRHIEYEVASKSPLFRMRNIRDIYDIVLVLTENTVVHYVNSEKKQKIIPAIEFIVKNYNREISNDDLARKCSMSTVYFRKLFKEIIGISPMAYSQNLRIEKGKEMLKSDYGSITDIALSLGYNNIYEFSKAFKSRVGVSPSKY